MSTILIEIPGCDDATDNGHLEKALEAVPGVESVEIDPASGTATVRHQGSDAGQLLAAVRTLGYEARASD